MVLSSRKISYIFIKIMFENFLKTIKTSIDIDALINSFDDK